MPTMDWTYSSNRALVPFDVPCSCGERATHGLVLKLKTKGQPTEATIWVCQKHIGKIEVVEVALATLPTHQPTAITKVAKFPPKPGEIFIGPNDMLVGCPACPALATLKPENFKIEGDKLTPSFICPNCGFHAWLTLEGSEEPAGE